MKIQVISSGSIGNCYKISNKDTTLLIECGIPYKKIQKALNFNVSNLDGCLVTHEHLDHAKSCMDLVKAGVNVYMTAGTQKVLSLESHRIKNFIPDVCGTYNSIEIGSFEVFAFETIHDAAEPVGFYVVDKSEMIYESLTFITDTQYCRYSFNTDYLMLEVNYVKETINSKENLNSSLRKRIKKTHMSLDTTLDFLSKCNLDHTKKIYVMHLSDSNSDERLIKDKIQELTGVSVVIC